MRLIDADKISLPIKNDTRKSGWDYGLMYAKNEIDNAPTIEAEPVRHGRCEYCKDGKSFIGAELILGNDGRFHKINHCPNCGAKMDGGC